MVCWEGRLAKIGLVTSYKGHGECWGTKSIFVFPSLKTFVFWCVYLWVSLCVPKILWTPYLKNQWRKFHPILVTNVFEFVDVLIRFWDQRSRSQQAVTQKLGEYNILVTVGANSTKIRSHTWPGDIQIKFSDQKVKGQGYSRWQPVEFCLQCVSKKHPRHF